MKLVIGYDGSDSAQAAIRGLRLAGLPTDVEVLVVCVADVSPPQPRDSDTEAASAMSGWHDAPIVKAAQVLVDESRAQAKMFATEGANFVQREFPRWKVSHDAYAGSPYLALVEASEAADLLIVGSQGKNAVGRFVLGSVSQNVLSHARCSVRVSRLVGLDSNAAVVAVMGYAYLKTGRYSFLGEAVRGFLRKNPGLLGRRHDLS